MHVQTEIEKKSSFHIFIFALLLRHVCDLSSVHNSMKVKVQKIQKEIWLNLFIFRVYVGTEVNEK